MNFLCKIGLHKWIGIMGDPLYISGWYFGTPKIGRVCAKCGIKELN